MDFSGDPCDTQAWREVGRTLAASWTEHDTDLTLDEAKEVYIAAREYHREQSAGQ